MNSLFGIKDLIINAEKKLKSIMSANAARIFFINEEEKLCYFSEAGELRVFPLNLGIVGNSIENHEILTVKNCYNDYLYNSLVDIDTSLPIICFPIETINRKEIFGAFEVINIHGINAKTKKTEINPSDLEILIFFSHQIAHSIIKNNEIEKYYTKKEIS